MNQRAIPRKPGQGLRQRMAALHTWVGLLLGWVLYAMFLTGTVAYFKDELSQWMRPELARLATVPDPALVAQRVADAFGQTTVQWSLRAPNERNNVAYAFWRSKQAGRRFDDGYLDADTGRPVSARATRGGDFFYRFHFQFHHIPVLWGRWLAGLAAMFMLVAIISGIITHKKIFTDFFTFRWGKGQRAWLDAHNALSVLGLPFHLMITYTGLVTLMVMYMPWGMQAAIKTTEERQAFDAQLSYFVQAGEPSGQTAPLASIHDMVRQAQARWGRDNIGTVAVLHPGDVAARVSVSRGEAGRVSMSPQTLLFEGHTGRLLAAQDRVGTAAQTRGVLYGLHLGRFGDTVTRWLYFMVSLAGTAMVGSGLVLWTVKRQQKVGQKPDAHGRLPFGHRVVQRLNIATIAGLSLAMTAFLWANRLLPTDMPDRANAEIQVFFSVWALALGHAWLRPVRSAWREQFWLATLGLGLLPVLNAVTTERPLWRSLCEGDWVFAGADLLFWVLAALHAVLAVRSGRHTLRPVAARRGVPAGSVS